MKPSWEHAPEWAKWLAQDSDSCWWWFEKRPEADEEYWGWIWGRMENAFPPLTSTTEWKQTLEGRPAKTKGGAMKDRPATKKSGATKEVDANYKAFVEILPSIIDRHRDQYALMKDKKILGFYSTAMDARTAAESFLSGKPFSIQKVTDAPVEIW